MTAPLLLRVTVRTPHGVPVVGATVTIAGAYRYQARELGEGVYLLPLGGEGDRQLVVQRYGAGGGSAGGRGFDHRTLRTTLSHRAPRVGGPAELLAFGATDGGLSQVTAIRPTPEGFECEVCLDYLWFTAVGSAPTEGNLVRVLIDGEEAWGAVADSLEAARQFIHITTWIYQPTAELRRPEPLTDPGGREPFTVQDLLEHRASSGVRVRLLLWDAPFIDIPREARRAEREANDNFEVMQEENQTKGGLLRADEYPLLAEILGQHPIFSFHQKTVVVDGAVGFCGGMNLKENDWDRSVHMVFEPRRARFEEPRGIRARIAEALEPAHHPPRHDFMVRIEGPAVADLAANFVERWEACRARGVDGAERSSEAVPPVRAGAAGQTAVQVIRTMPAPYGVGGLGERGILDVYLRAIRAARRLIYIEDQYFRSTLLSDALADAVRSWPELMLVVVTSREYANDPLQGGWCWESFARIQERRSDLELYTLVVRQAGQEGEVHELEVDIHAKLLLVDDLFFTLGSCNINDRGFEIEGEINVAVPDAALARETRLRLWREHLANDHRLTGDIASDLAVWREHAEANRPTGGEVYPISSVVPFRPTPRASVFDRSVW